MVVVIVDIELEHFNSRSKIQRTSHRADLLDTSIVGRFEVPYGKVFLNKYATSGALDVAAGESKMSQFFCDTYTVLMLERDHLFVLEVDLLNDLRWQIEEAWHGVGCRVLVVEPILFREIRWRWCM